MKPRHWPHILNQIKCLESGNDSDGHLEIILKDTPLKEFGIVNTNNAPPINLTKIASLIEKNKNLTSLSINGQFQTDAKGMQMLAANKHLRELCLSGGPNIHKFSILYVQLNFTLAEALVNNTTLVILQLDKMLIDDNFIAKLVENKSITTLSLYGNFISDIGVGYLANMSSLESLDIGSNPNITEIGAKVIL